MVERSQRAGALCGESRRLGNDGNKALFRSPWLLYGKCHGDFFVAKGVLAVDLLHQS